MKRIVILALVISALCFDTIAQVNSVVFEEDIIIVAPEEFGNMACRIELNGNGDPIVLHGKSSDNAGLYISILEEESFGTSILVTPHTNIYLSESEGPRMAVSGTRVAVSYQILGEWQSGAYVVVSEDGGYTWGEPYGLAPNATVDHFMPIVSFDGVDGVGEPWVALKWGNNPVLEGIHLFNSDTDTFGSAINGSGATDGVSVCECCPSNTFWHNGTYYDVVRNNNANLRDFWLLKSDDGITWEDAIDIDETDWVASICPGTGASSVVLENGTLLSAYMSAVDGSRVYWSTVDLDNFSYISYGRIDPLANSTENHPQLSASGMYVVAAWERNNGGYDVMVSVGSSGSGGGFEIPLNATEDLSGHNRNPDVVYDGDFVHLVYKSSSDGVVHYRKCVVYNLAVDETITDKWNVLTDESRWVIKGIQGEAQYSLFDISGRIIESGNCYGTLIIENLIGSYIVKVEQGDLVKSFKLIK